MKTIEELLKIYSSYLPYRIEFKLPLTSERYDDLTEGCYWRGIDTLETAIDKNIEDAIELRDMVMCQRDPFLAIEEKRIFLGELVTNSGFEIDDVFVDEVKPILYSMDYLTKDEFRFIWENETDLESLEQCLSLDPESFLSCKFSYLFWSELFKNHFNVFSLSDSEFIKKETLNK